ncbi:SGNH/GDSL hydrolase family protein [Desulfosporosinus fructosivorans]|uniref:SGNH/GDSL hydrolase family protein n=1 Tax=Desulfosporosinus fructosivorans TaxID=2018669 RepID=A0A4Z0R4U1_9FIRM|nr:SGNH/GDSL hydrolase family protein [Desulfosporosinus fructosivorans]TGE37027.1 SGNH/GDSL hydrolase family protein [Desulfosporosinus fructosivorans]
MKHKKIIIYLLSATLAFTLVSLGIPETVTAAEQPVITAAVTKANPLTGIKKLEKAKVSAVILGDSIAVSQGVSNPLKNGWTKELKTSLFKKYSNNIVWDNKASSGTTIDYCLQRATEIKSTTDAVFICVGRNDRNIYTPKQFSKKYAQLIRVIKRKAPDADIFCIVEPPMVSEDESLFLGIRTAIMEVSDKTESNLLDLWSIFPREQITLDGLLSDGLHPNTRGYKLISNYMYKRLVRVINAA